MFAPSSSDDDGASRDDDLGAHLATLTRLACQAQTLVADLLFAADAQHVTFDLDRHPERADVLFDLEYLRHPGACDARLSASPALRRVDEACRAACQFRVWRAYRSFADVVEWHASFAAFCESLREGDERLDGESSSTESEDDVTDGTRVSANTPLHPNDDETIGSPSARPESSRESRRARRGRRRAARSDEENEAIARNSPGRAAREDASSFRAASRSRAFREAVKSLVATFASALLVLQNRFEPSFLERVVAQRARWSHLGRVGTETRRPISDERVRRDRRDDPPPSWDAVVALCRSVSRPSVSSTVGFGTQQRGEEVTTTRPDADATKSGRSFGSFGVKPSAKNNRRPVPGAGPFARLALPAFVAELALESCADDFAASAPTRSRPRGSGRAEDRDERACSDDARGAREACLCLFFAPETLRADHGFMRDVVDARFPRAFVTNVCAAGGIIVDIATTWFPFEAARRALVHSRTLCVAAELDDETRGVAAEEPLEDDRRPRDASVASGDRDPSLGGGGSFFAHSGRRAAAARLVAEHAADLTAARADLVQKKLFWPRDKEMFFFFFRRMKTSQKSDEQE